DSQVRRIDFRNTVLIMTSNVGSELIPDRDTLGFADQSEGSDEPYQEMKGRVIGEARNVFRPEFLNRLDDIIVFHQLNRSQVREIATLMVGELKARLTAERKMGFRLDDSAWELLIRLGYDPKYGARPMRRMIERLIENPISEEILVGRFAAGTNIVGRADGDELRFEEDG
ncbi:MAG: AAA family ATPase, partial [Candidatus Bipolaricaulota bacterium]|nr:AAA family ATPase [Candidatus Bipolaricaulota bacterium]